MLFFSGENRTWCKKIVVRAESIENWVIKDEKLNR